MPEKDRKCSSISNVFHNQVLLFWHFAPVIYSFIFTTLLLHLLFSQDNLITLLPFCCEHVDRTLLSLFYLSESHRTTIIVLHASTCFSNAQLTPHFIQDFYNSRTWTERFSREHIPLIPLYRILVLINHNYYCNKLGLTSVLGLTIYCLNEATIMLPVGFRWNST